MDYDNATSSPTDGDVFGNFDWDSFWNPYWDDNWDSTWNNSFPDHDNNGQPDTPITTDSVAMILRRCGSPRGEMVWLGLKVFMLAAALLANSTLLWLLLKSRHNLTPSQLLAFNVAVLNVLYSLSLSLDIYYKLSPNSEIIHDVIEFFSGFIMFGCPLFLMFMCLERYIAAVFPLTYLRLGKRGHRIALSAVAWIATLSVSTLLYFVNEFPMVLSLAVIISVFFLVMFLCLVGIAYVLFKGKPGDGANSSDSLKKRALFNIIMVILPSAVAYSPLVAVMCYLAIILSSGGDLYTEERCTVLQYLLAFPNLGLLVGPLFYSSMLREIICCKTKQTTTPNEETRAVEEG